MYIVHYTLSIIHCALYIVHYTLSIIQCALYIVQCTLYKFVQNKLLRLTRDFSVDSEEDILIMNEEERFLSKQTYDKGHKDTVSSLQVHGCVRALSRKITY